MRFILCTLLLALSLPHQAFAQSPLDEPQDESANRALDQKYTRDYKFTYIPKEKNDRYKKLVDSLDCAACGTQKLSEVKTPLTRMLKRDIYSLIDTKETDQGIYKYINENYNHIVSYGIALPNEELDATEYIPLALCIFALIAAFFFIRKKERQQTKKDA